MTARQKGEERETDVNSKKRREGETRRDVEKLSIVRGEKKEE